MDFTDNAGTTKKINKWCSDHTGGLIPEILKSVDANMLAYLMNATYFKSQWKDKFSKDKTSPEDFTTEAGSRKRVQMMKNNLDCLYQDNDVFRAARLPYGNGAFAMYVILPSGDNTLAGVAGSLNGKSWEEFERSMVPCRADLWLPKFETTFHIDLKNILSEMGMPSSFNALNADFTA